MSGRKATYNVHALESKIPIQAKSVRPKGANLLRLLFCPKQTAVDLTYRHRALTVVLLDATVQNIPCIVSM